MNWTKILMWAFHAALVTAGALSAAHVGGIWPMIVSSSINALLPSPQGVGNGGPGPQV